MRIAPLALALAVATLVGLSAPAARSTLQRAGDPVPLRGTPLRGETGLRLLIAANPPVILDIDTGRAKPLPGVRPMNRGTLTIVGIAGRVAVVVARSARRHADLYAVRGREPRVSALGTGTDVIPAPDGRSVWVKSFTSASQCALRRTRLDGRQIRAPRAFPCASTIYPAGSLGVIVNRTHVIDPLTGRTILRTRWGVLATAGAKLVLAGPNNQLTLLDATTGVQQRLTRPSKLALDDPAVDPRGRFVALAFANPAWKAKQILDVWLLDTKTAKLKHLPGMPALVSLKRTSMAWTDDGRLVLLGESSGRDVVAVWRPGQRHLAGKTVDLPERGESGSDSFALFR
jgi:hypothetical protein